MTAGPGITAGTLPLACWSCFSLFTSATRSVFFLLIFHSIHQGSTFLHPDPDVALPGERVWLRCRQPRKLAPLLGAEPVLRRVQEDGRPRCRLRSSDHQAAGQGRKNHSVHWEMTRKTSMKMTDASLDSSWNKSKLEESTILPMGFDERNISHLGVETTMSLTGKNLSPLLRKTGNHGGTAG